jgi:GNAT superfamily N-acetyltransferase
LDHPPNTDATPAAAGQAGSPQAPQPRPATSDEVSPLARVLASAFLEDPPFVWMLPDERRRAERLCRFFEIELRHVGLARGTVWTTDELAGAAVWAAPGNWRLPWLTQLRLGRAYTRAFGARLPRAGRLLARVEARHPRRPHYYLPFVGVAPEHQGRGLGTALMQPTLERCARDGLPAYLEATCERNARLYARLGFELIHELKYGGNEPLRLMLRPAP